MSDLYDEVALFSFRYLGFKYLDEIDRLTIPDFQMHLKAQAYIAVDKDHERHSLAYLIQCAKDTTANGKPKYPKFKNFYDYEKHLKKLEKPETKHKHWREYLKRKKEASHE